MNTRLEALLDEMESLGYACNEAKALCRLPKRPTAEQIEQAIEFLEQQIEFAKKCLQSITPS